MERVPKPELGDQNKAEGQDKAEDQDTARKGAAVRMTTPSA